MAHECWWYFTRPLKSERVPLSDVPAVYFVEPTQENITKISEVSSALVVSLSIVMPTNWVHIILQDLTRDLYELYYINFCSALPRPLLEQLADDAIITNTSHQIAQVYDQYLNFICLESNLFTLGLKDSFFKLNNPATPDAAIENLIDRVVSGLLAVFVTSGKRVLTFAFARALCN